MATPSKNSRVARMGDAPKRQRITHLLFHGEKPGETQIKPLGRYTSLEEAEAAQAKFKHKTLVVEAWGGNMK